MKRYIAVFNIMVMIFMFCGGSAFAYGQVGPEEKNNVREIDNSGQFKVSAEDMYVDSGISGPSEVNQIRNHQTPWQRYAYGSSSRMAILVTDLKSDWLGLAHGLKSIGVPFVVTQDVQQAIRHKMVLAYPMLSGSTMSPQNMAALSAYAKSGGTLVAVQPLANSLQGLFGFIEAIPTRKHNTLSFKPESLTRTMDDPRESTLTLSGSRLEDSMGSYSFLYPKGQVVAAYEDGSAAIVKRGYGRGGAYAVGLDLGHWLLNGYNSRAEASARSYINEYEPSLDILLIWLKELYQKAEPDAVTLYTVPSGKALSIILTHDVDFTQSLVNAAAYAEFEKSVDIKGTYFIQTKYIRDYYDEIFYNDKFLPYIRQIKEKGMELASHTVSHTRLFSYLPTGSGNETYPSYQPYISGFYSVHNATVFGEARVSKFLLEQAAGQSIVSFRAGHLGNPQALPQVLEACGYQYSSNVTANTALSHLPFQLMYSRDNGTEVDVYEFPVTIEDELNPPMGSRLDKAIQLGNKLSLYGGSMVVLIHPNILADKLAFEEGLVKAYKKSAWFGSLGQFGKWWSARDHVEIDVTVDGNIRIVNLRLAQAIDDLSLDIPANWRLQDGPGRQQGKMVIISSGAGEALLTFQVL